MQYKNMQYKKRTPLVTVEAVTFNQLIEHGKKETPQVVNDMPWSFKWHDIAITQRK